jgi:hypothetical protein
MVQASHPIKSVDQSSNLIYFRKASLVASQINLATKQVTLEQEFTWQPRTLAQVLAKAAAILNGHELSVVIGDNLAVTTPILVSQQGQAQIEADILTQVQALLRQDSSTLGIDWQFIHSSAAPPKKPVSR